MKSVTLLKTISVLSLFGFSLSQWGCPAQKSDLENWVDQVSDHMSKNEGGRLLAEAIQAHGGHKQWLLNEVLEFRWTYHMTDRGPNAVTETLQRVDTSSLEAVHELPGSDVRFGWTGKEAWLMPADAPRRPNPRFWALTPYYFIGIPFVFADLNSNFEKFEAGIEFEGTVYDQVKVTFNPGTGDAPDDYYIVLIHPETRLVGGVRYIVTSKLVARNGPGPEKLLTLEDYAVLGDIHLPSKHRTFSMDGNSPKDHMRSAEATEYQWLKRAAVDFEVPEGAARF